MVRRRNPSERPARPQTDFQAPRVFRKPAFADYAKLTVPNVTTGAVRAPPACPCSRPLR